MLSREGVFAAVVARRGLHLCRTVAFQTGYAGSIPVARSGLDLRLLWDDLDFEDRHDTSCGSCRRKWPRRSGVARDVEPVASCGRCARRLQSGLSVDDHAGPTTSTDGSTSSRSAIPTVTGRRSSRSRRSSRAARIWDGRWSVASEVRQRAQEGSARRQLRSRTDQGGLNA